MTNSLSTVSPDALTRGDLVDPVTGKMVWIPGGTFRMGSDRHYVEEAPAHRVTVGGFWIDRFPVTIDPATMFVLASALATRVLGPDIGWRSVRKKVTRRAVNVPARRCRSG